MERMESQIESRFIEVEEPNLEELLEDNKEYLEWLTQEVGLEAKEKYENYLRDLITERLMMRIIGFPLMTQEIKMVKFGKIFIWPYTTSSPANPKISDPINLSSGKMANQTSSAILWNKLYLLGTIHES